MRMRRAEHVADRHARQDDVVHIAPAASEQPGIFEPRDALANRKLPHQGFLSLACHRRPQPRRADSWASARSGQGRGPAVRACASAEQVSGRGFKHKRTRTAGQTRPRPVGKNLENNPMQRTWGWLLSVTN